MRKKVKSHISSSIKTRFRSDLVRFKSVNLFYKINIDLTDRNYISLLLINYKQTGS